MRIAMMLAVAATVFASEPSTVDSGPLGCAGSTTLGTFQLSVRPFTAGSALPLKSVASITGGARLIWSPAHLRLPPSNSAEVTVIVVPAGDGELLTLEPHKASERAEWQLLERPTVVALVYGPQGLSEGKLQSLVTRNQDLLRELAEYAEQSSQVEDLVQQLADAEEARGGADNALKGVSAEYGVNAQKLNSATTPDQQASLLLGALVPTANAFDPLASQSTQVQQTGGLAASVAGLFFGNPVALAAGGATLFANLKTLLFPNTEFRSAFAQNAGKGDLALCTKASGAKTKTRAAYLWAYRVPQLPKPAFTLAKSPNVPLGMKSTVELKAGKATTMKDLAFARDWRLVSDSGQGGYAVPITTTPAGAVDIDLSKVKVPAGDYQLGFAWNWDSLAVGGTLHIHPAGDLSTIVLAPDEHDKLIEGRGIVTVELRGPDFEFLDKATIQSSARGAKPEEVPFNLPLGKGAGPQNVVAIDIDTGKAGVYTLALSQTDDVTRKVPITVLPENPKISNLPLRFNTGEKSQAIRLKGSGMDRIEAVTSEAGKISGASDGDDWSGEIHLKADTKQGQTFALVLKVKGLDNPLTVADAVEIVGLRPRIQSVQKSLSNSLGIDISADELPAGVPAGLVLNLDQMHDSTRARVDIRCASGELRHELTLAAGTAAAGASLTTAGPGALYLSFDPGAVGYSGCKLAATVMVDPDGKSDPYVLGRVIRVPRLDKFTLSGEKVSDTSYAGTVDGHDLDVIEKVGWDATDGLPVDGIPTPIPGEHPSQSLRVVLPWPAPAPHAPLYVWLRGESQGRKTTVSY
ncbi:MAG TPA: hypothetical protein VMB03_31335 [Bryobacteraceae bacterium]|nr:hypothetical protein [Bryobacteraceae bacterium]